MSLITMPPPTQTETAQPAPAALSTARGPYLFLITALVILADRLTKRWIIHRIRPGYTIPVIPHFFRLSHVLNTGAAFSLLENLPPNAVRLGLIAFSVFAAVIVFILLWRTGRAISLTSVALALILGGALGNLYDRIRFHHVVEGLAWGTDR